MIDWLGLASGPEYFFYLNQGGTYDADGQNDPKDYQEMRVCHFRRGCSAH